MYRFAKYEVSRRFGRRCDLEPSTVDVGRVAYASKEQMHIVLSNKGLVRAHWQFMPLPGAMFGDPSDSALRPAPRWAHVTPSEVCTIMLSAFPKRAWDDLQKAFNILLLSNTDLDSTQDLCHSNSGIRA